MNLPILAVLINQEHDIVAARQRARQIAQLIGFDAQDQTRIATAVSEIARNAYKYASGGRVEFIIEGNTAPQVLFIRISDQGPGIPQLEQILDGQYHSETGLGLGLIGARRLMDQFTVESAEGQGTIVSLRKLFPKRAPFVTVLQLKHITDELAIQKTLEPVEEIQAQNQELLRTLDELRKRQEELLRLNHELEDTNRGVVALYAELDEKADHLRRADELKSKFLSNMSHEFRTPLNSITALSRLLLDHADGPLTSEQEKQVNFIRKAADDLMELVNDLLDLAKVEAGKIEIHPAEFRVADLFGALRGMLRPLLVSGSVNLIFEEPDNLPPLDTDEGKVSQILRNLISNALKFTERGEVRVSAWLDRTDDLVIFAVADTGIGIAPEDQERIFQEFTQLDSPLQKRVRGTGLGLPLSRKLAELLGGNICVESQVGVGSTFRVTIPISYREQKEEPEFDTVVGPVTDERIPVLVVEDAEEDLIIYEHALGGTLFRLMPARNLRQAREILKRKKPQAIILDILLQGEDAWSFLTELKTQAETREIPVAVISTVDDRHKGLGLGADAYWVKPVEPGWLRTELGRLTGREPEKPILIIEDEEAYRYVLRKYLAGLPYPVNEAATGSAGLAFVRQEIPALILLDLKLPDLDGTEVLKRLKADPQTCDIPVIIITSQTLPDADRQRLNALARAVFSKTHLTRQVLVETIEKQNRTPA